MSVWCLASVVLTYFDSGCLVSFVTVPKLRPIVENLNYVIIVVQLMGLGHLECVPYQHSELTTGTFSSFNLTSTSCGFLRKRDGAGGSCGRAKVLPGRCWPSYPNYYGRLDCVVSMHVCTHMLRPFHEMGAPSHKMIPQQCVPSAPAVAGPRSRSRAY